MTKTEVTHEWCDIIYLMREGSALNLLKLRSSSWPIVSARALLARNSSWSLRRKLKWCFQSETILLWLFSVVQSGQCWWRPRLVLSVHGHVDDALQAGKHLIIISNSARDGSVYLKYSVFSGSVSSWRSWVFSSGNSVSKLSSWLLQSSGQSPKLGFLLLPWPTIGPAIRAAFFSWLTFLVESQ